MVPTHPMRAAKLSLWLAKEYDPSTVLAFLLTEFVVNLAAMADFAFGRAHSQWISLPSTKTLVQ
jgi:hypothetical protein